jgi:hypothetical protein
VRDDDAPAAPLEPWTADLTRRRHLDAQAIEDMPVHACPLDPMPGGGEAAGAGLLLPDMLGGLAACEGTELNDLAAAVDEALPRVRHRLPPRAVYRRIGLLAPCGGRRARCGRLRRHGPTGVCPGARRALVGARAMVRSDGAGL